MVISSCKNLFSQTFILKDCVKLVNRYAFNEECLFKNIILLKLDPGQSWVGRKDL